MDTLEAIAARRSIRVFKDTPIDEDVIRKILTAAIQAPSSKNGQPWRFIVVSKEKRAEMVRIFRQEIAYWKAQGRDTGSCEPSAAIMEQAPVNILVIYPDLNIQEHLFSEDLLTKAGSAFLGIGACIQNMLLAAQDLGLGSLWIADVSLADRQVCTWLGEEGTLVSAVSLGYANENPGPRPRKPFDNVVRII